MKFLGWLFVVLMFTFVVGFFADWFDVSKHDGIVSIHVNSRHIGQDIKYAGETVGSVFQKAAK